jgi:cbb3-type cytochrome oxidase maturation protein
MSYLALLLPVALAMGFVGLMAFLWSLRSGQYDDLDGAAVRVLLADAADVPLHQNAAEPTKPSSNHRNG